VLKIVRKREERTSKKGYHKAQRYNLVLSRLKKKRYRRMRAGLLAVGRRKKKIFSKLQKTPGWTPKPKRC